MATLKELNDKEGFMLINATSEVEAILFAFEETSEADKNGVTRHTSICVAQEVSSNLFQVDYDIEK